jgi:hypothetical protein
MGKENQSKAKKKTKNQKQTNEHKWTTHRACWTNEPEDARAAARVLQQARVAVTRKHNAREKTEGGGTEP